MSYFFALTLLFSQFSQASILNEDEPKHLFILSGQSNMQGVRPKESFTPAVEKAFGKNRVIVVMDAHGGQPIRRWYKDKDAESDKSAGDLYDRLMKKVAEAAKGQKLESVTLVWMQGERDAREKLGDRYTDCLSALRSQICEDLGVDQINFVIGRINDFDLNDQRYKHWTKIRQVQVDFANANSQTEWVNTDDLNDGKNQHGKDVKNDLHCTVEGFKVLGKRFANTAISLINTTKE